MNRFKRVIDNYQTTTHVREALERLVECDLALGLDRRSEEERCLALGHNYPGSEWYVDADNLVTTGNPGEAPQGWFARNFGTPF